MSTPKTPLGGRPISRKEAFKGLGDPKTWKKSSEAVNAEFRAKPKMKPPSLVNDCCSDPDICHCPCHEPGSHTMHFAPCCNVCPKCGKNIHHRAYKRHVEECQASEQAVVERNIMDIPKDKNYPTDSVQCDNCGGHGCSACENRGWFAPNTHPMGRKCEREGCGKPIPPNQVAVYCTNECAYKDAQ